MNGDYLTMAGRSSRCCAARSALDLQERNQRDPSSYREKKRRKKKQQLFQALFYFFACILPAEGSTNFDQRGPLVKQATTRKK